MDQDGARCHGGRPSRPAVLEATDVLTLERFTDRTRPLALWYSYIWPCQQTWDTVAQSTLDEPLVRSAAFW
jgi:hypothetical protein